MSNENHGINTGGTLLARGARVLRHGEVIAQTDYRVDGGMVNTATPVPIEWVGRAIFEGTVQSSVLRLP